MGEETVVGAEECNAVEGGAGEVVGYFEGWSWLRCHVGWMVYDGVGGGAGGR
jgi:hypothetical protein